MIEHSIKPGLCIILDEEDADLLMYNWGTAAHGYATTSTRGKHKSLGRYPTEEEAARVRDAAAREVYGEFARLNDVD